MANDYITLENSTGSVVKRFKAIGLSTPWVRTDQVKTLLDGSPDKASGAILYPRQYNLRVPYQVVDSNYGTLADLKTLFELNNPNGTPNDVITLTDHLGNTVDVFFMGQADPQPVSTIIDGAQAFYMVPIVLREVTVAVGSGS